MTVSQMSSLRRWGGVGILFALGVALIVTLIMLLAPVNWGPKLWPFYSATAGVLVWTVIDLWSNLRRRPNDSGDAAVDASDTDALFQDTDIAAHVSDHTAVDVHRVDSDGSEPSDRPNWRRYDKRMGAARPLRSLSSPSAWCVAFGDEVGRLEKTSPADSLTTVALQQWAQHKAEDPVKVAQSWAKHSSASVLGK